MKAIDFIKKHDADKAREIIDRSSFGTHYRVDTGEIICCHNENHFYFVDQFRLGVEFVRIVDLKTLVESVDLVKSYGGIINAKHDVKYLDLDWDYDTPRVTRLKQAIADYEQLFGNTETLELETLRDCDPVLIARSLMRG